MIALGVSKDSWSRGFLSLGGQCNEFQLKLKKCTRSGWETQCGELFCTSFINSERNSRRLLRVLCSDTAEWLCSGKSQNKRQVMVPYCMDKAGKLSRHAGNLGWF